MVLDSTGASSFGRGRSRRTIRGATAVKTEWLTLLSVECRSVGATDLRTFHLSDCWNYFGRGLPAFYIGSGALRSDNQQERREEAVEYPG